MAKRHPSNPLALAVLALLFERPMHPYEMAATLKERGKEDSIKLRYGSLYTVIELLLRDRLIAAKETQREGGRPERTVYSITPSGEAELRQWMRDILGVPVKEYPQFEAGLSLLPVLPPDEAVATLKDRLGALDREIESRRRIAQDALDRQRVHPLFMIEGDYRVAILATERAFVAALIDRIVADDWNVKAAWRRLHEERARTGRIGVPPMIG
jgi:DNA-binding PadR family transcriptional regulator